MKKLALFVSTLLHPIFVPFIACFLLITNSILYIPNPEIAKLTLQSIFIISIAIPLISVFILKWSGMISSIRIPNVKERKIPYFITFIAYLFIGLFFGKTSYIPFELSILFLSTSLNLLILFFLIPITKASAHMACFGGIIGALFILNSIFHYKVSHFIPFLFILAGIVGWSRLELKAHSQNQLFQGFCIGFISQFLGFIIFR